MKEFIRDFNRRVAEILKYFELVDKIEQLVAIMIFMRLRL